MPKTTVHRADGTLVGELPSVAEEPPVTPKSEMVKVGDGPGFYAYIVRPQNFDPNKRYPIIDYVYGGPGQHQGLATMNTRPLAPGVRGQGFLVVALHNTGPPGPCRARGQPIT